MEMLAKTPEEKRELVKILEKDDPEILEFLKQVSNVFGPLPVVRYERLDNGKY